MPMLVGNLAVPRCPHCAIAHPSLTRQQSFETRNHEGANRRFWAFYACGTCGGVVSAWSLSPNGVVSEYYPEGRIVEQDIPERPRAFLTQALESLHAPAGAVMLAASAVDSMLKLKGYLEGSLYARIEKAVESHLLTKEMGQWAHAVRLDANDQRHADEAVDLPTEADAKRVINFAEALAEILFVLPSKVARGLQP